MKRLAFLGAMILALVSLCGCEGHYPAKAADGADWDRSWTILGTVLGIEQPGDGLVLSENPVVLAGDDTHYANWTVGEGMSYTNSDGKDAIVYDAQLFLLLYGCADQAHATETVAQWLEREQEVYDIRETEYMSVNGIDYTLLHYGTRSADNPYAGGVVAFCVFENYALSAELTCGDDYSENAEEVLLRFLEGCHFSAELTQGGELRWGCLRQRSWNTIPVSGRPVLTVISNCSPSMEAAGSS